MRRGSAGGCSPRGYKATWLALSRAQARPRLTARSARLPAPRHAPRSARARSYTPWLLPLHCVYVCVLSCCPSGRALHSGPLTSRLSPCTPDVVFVVLSLSLSLSAPPPPSLSALPSSEHSSSVTQNSAGGHTLCHTQQAVRHLLLRILSTARRSPDYWGRYYAPRLLVLVLVLALVPVLVLMLLMLLRGTWRCLRRRATNIHPSHPSEGNHRRSSPPPLATLGGSSFSFSSSARR